MIRHPLGLLAVLCGAVALSVLLERRSRFFARMSAALTVILLGASLSNAGLVPSESPVYDAVFERVAPVAVVLLLLRVHLASLRRVGPAVLAAFALGALGTVAGAFLGTIALRDLLGEDGWKLGGMFAATYIGGSLNFVAVGRQYPIPPDAFAAVNAADVIVTAMWMGVTIYLPGPLRRFYPARDLARAEPGREEPLFGGPRANAPDAGDLAALAVLSLGVLAVSARVARSLPGVPEVLWYTTLALVLAQIPGVRRIRGTEAAGLGLVYLFLGAIGAQCDVARMLDAGKAAFALAATLTAVHGIVVFGAGRALRLPVEAIALASNAGIGGPASAAALAKSLGWSDLVLPGILAGLLGYAAGTYAGVGVAEALRAILSPGG